MCKMSNLNQDSLLCNQIDACTFILKNQIKNLITTLSYQRMLKTGLLTGQLDIFSQNTKLETIKLNNGFGMNKLDKFTMLNLQTTFCRTTKENSWLPMLEAPLKEFQLSSQETKENGSTTKSIIYSLLKLVITLTLLEHSVLQDQTNTPRLVLKT